MVTTIGQTADTPTTVVRLYPNGEIPVNVSQNILGIIGTASAGPAMTVYGCTSSQQVKNTYISGPLCRAGQLAFYNSLQDAYMVRVLGSGYATASYQLEDGLSNHAGMLTAASDGNRGNSAKLKIEYGTFHSHDAEYFPGDGTVGPYYLEFADLIGPWPATGTDKNSVTVDAVPFTPVYTAPELATGCVYVNKTTGSLTFYAGEAPSAYSNITVNIAYRTRKISVIDGSTTYPAIDNRSDQAAIQAVLADNPYVRYAADSIVTHLPQVGTYSLTGGSDGAAITSNDWDLAIQALRDYLDVVKTGITAVTLTQTSVDEDDHSYDLLSLAEGHCAEMEQDWEPCLWILGGQENEDTADMIQIVSPHAHRNMIFVANPWGNETDPPRTNGWVALAAREAQIGLGDDTGERSSLNALMGMQGLLTTYRRDTVRGLQNNRITVLVKEDAALFPNWSRTLGIDWQFADAVDNRTVNYILRMLYAVCKKFYFKKNIPSVREDLKGSIAQELNNLLSRYVAVKYILEVRGPGDAGYTYTDNGRVDINLQVENVGHIKRIMIDYGVGILEDGSNVVYAPNIYAQD